MIGTMKRIGKWKKWAVEARGSFAHKGSVGRYAFDSESEA
jgi:hypothetical protein